MADGAALVIVLAAGWVVWIVLPVIGMRKRVARMAMLMGVVVMAARVGRGCGPGLRLVKVQRRKRPGAKPGDERRRARRQTMAQAAAKRPEVVGPG